MKNLFTLLTMMLLLLGATACGSGAVDEDSSDESMEEAAQMDDAEEAESAPLSPRRKAEGSIGSATVVVDYGSPSVRNRQIWGNLVPYGQVWRTGANEATTIEFSKDVMVEGKSLKAGTYSVFTIPNEDSWTIIFNSETGQWGTNYNESTDVLRVEVESQEIEEKVEAMQFSVEDDGLVLRWDRVAVPIAVMAG